MEAEPTETTDDDGVHRGEYTRRSSHLSGVAGGSAQSGMESSATPPLALVLGGIQSVIRATVANMAPAGRAGATVGLLHVGTKIAGCVASLAFGLAYEFVAAPRAGLAVLVLQLLAGWWALRRASPAIRSA